MNAAPLDRTLAALADPHRRCVVDMLSRGPRAAGDLAREVGLPAPAMSRHLRTLRESGLVEESHPPFDARVRIYALRPEPMDRPACILSAELFRNKVGGVVAFT